MYINFPHIVLEKFLEENSDIIRKDMEKELISRRACVCAMSFLESFTCVESYM